MSSGPEGEAERHRSMVNRVISLASRLGSSPGLLEMFLATGEKLCETIGDIDSSCWGELKVEGQIKAGELSHLKVGIIRSYQVRA